MSESDQGRKGWFLKPGVVAAPKPTLAEKAAAAKAKVRERLEQAGSVCGAATGNMRARIVTARESVGERALWFNAALGSAEFSRRIDGFLQHAFTHGAPTKYDQAMDAAYNATHDGGNLHRLFDGNHDLFGAWRACREAGGDSLADDVVGYVDAVMKDLFTAKGLPIITFDKDGLGTFAQVVEDHFHINSAWIFDAVSVTGTELLGCVGGTLALALNWKDEDRQRFAELTGSLGVSALAAANPLLAVVVLVCAARCYQTTRATGNVRDTLAEIAAGGAASAFGSAVVIGAMSVIGGPAWVGLMVGICCSVLARQACIRAGRAAVETDWRETVDFIRAYLLRVVSVPARLSVAMKPL